MSCKTAKRKLRSGGKIVNYDVRVQSASSWWTHTRGVSTLRRAREIAREVRGFHAVDVVVVKVTYEPVPSVSR